MISEAGHSYVLSFAEFEKWVYDEKCGIGNALRADQLDVKEQYERRVKDLQEALGQSDLEAACQKNCSPCLARGTNKNTVQRIFKLKWGQVKKRAIGFRPRIYALPSVATAPNERWSTELCRIWAGRDEWVALALVIDCRMLELLSWHLSRKGKATTASSDLEHALIAQFGTLGCAPEPFPFRSDNV